MTAILWVAVLFLIGLAVMVLEVFVPSGGILGFVSLAALAASVGTAFLQIGAVAGLLVLAGAVVTVPVVLGLAFRWFPHTPLGRRVLPPPPDPADVLPDAARRRRLREMVGRHGRTVSELLPWGGIDVGDGVIEAMSESGPIDAGVEIEVVGVQGAALVVRRAEAARTPDPAPPARPRQPDPSADGDTAMAADSPLSPTLEAFDFDSWEPPRA